MRMQVTGCEFVATARLRVPEIDRHALQRILRAAEAGECVLRLRPGAEILGQRLLAMETPLSWNTSWVRAHVLYVVSGVPSGLASGLLPDLVAIGARNFLFLVNRRQPDQNLVQEMKKRGATSICVQQCDLTNEDAVRQVIRQALLESKATRVGGVFHLAGIDVPHKLPVSREEIEKVVSVKYQGHVTLMKCTDLKEGDIFCVPGSISMLVGSNGIAYAAVNHACRALQRQLASKGVIAPYPCLPYSDILFRNSSLWKGSTGEQFRNAGIMATGRCSFSIGQLHPSASPTEDSDTCLLRLVPERTSAFLNTLSPNKLLDELCVDHVNLR